MIIIKDIYHSVHEKLNRIIEREGDADGLRNTPEYFNMLLHEEIVRYAITQYCNDMRVNKQRKTPSTAMDDVNSYTKKRDITKNSIPQYEVVVNSFKENIWKII